ncbi:hypothetical protein [Mucilaginibacter phyllosphaerae]|uniref:Uncharacterized protein n=1 Tax=Mucilaginibacter phyllosphaerae TaxID=1812349 RepID=A0A4Y8AEC0_9SPHI|nr:hypothetical protein [Mucilaginibacter phyllosphaerae]MBB3970037.1 hypothetical protein [Mucilaginibacter phyllosphaerae]TEW66431.1 hypothetical protein E2R65_08350 [Mucilaginibacter phyllosphaerae]GGH09310.1 hypothetical protein GCM10007352_14700 [Mucilaginibacter phyllosphaerae]
MQKLAFFIVFLSMISLADKKPAYHHHEEIPALFKGNFVDDYGIRYTVNDTLFMQLPRTRYHIIKWNVKDQYIVARNDAQNPGEGGLYTRIDYMQFSNMDPWKWGFCLSVYDAKTDQIAEATAKADRQNPRKGCNGFPFSRMKRKE